jgi:hypothetical protein
MRRVGVGLISDAASSMMYGVLSWGGNACPAEPYGQTCMRMPLRHPLGLHGTLDEEVEEFS